MSQARGCRTKATPFRAFVLFVVLATLASSAAMAQTKGADGAIRIHVRGSAQIKATATSETSGTILRGELLDDAGTPIGGATITIRALGPEGGAALTLPPPSPCEAATPRARRFIRLLGTDEYVIEADEHGAFCVRAPASLERATIKIRFEGDALRDASESSVALDALDTSLARTILRFEPAPDMIDLDRETVSLAASLRVDRSGSGRAGPNAPRREGQPIVLEDERGEIIARSTTGGDGRVRFEVRTATLAGPGTGELRLQFDGTTALAKANAAQPIVRRAEARLALAHPVDTGDPEDGVPIDVDVSTSRGAVSGGLVEAIRGKESVGTGTVDGGKARVIASFPFERAGTVPLELRYVPAAPYFRAGAPIAIEVHVSGPGITRQIVIALVVLAVTAWIIFGWRRAPLPKPETSDDADHPMPSGRAGVDVVRSTSGQSGWRGSVLDAHDGMPIPGARLSVIAPAFQGDGVVTQVLANDRGQFVIDVPYRSDARLVIEAQTHSKHEQALPPPGVLRVALITRRRALLERLVRWARRTGVPFDVQPEPTPGHVRRAAFRANNPEVEDWARALEHAVYGPSPVDESVETKLSADEPRGNRRPEA
jgi:hypothetical protein